VSKSTGAHHARDKRRSKQSTVLSSMPPKAPI
jgi:hypothetical protein